MPTFALEHSVWEKNPDATIAGLDEAGRGPWAGPVFAAAAILNPRHIPSSLINRLDDSKKLSASAREDIFAQLQGCAGVRLGIAAATVTEIDTLNILQATYLAMTRALESLGCAVDVALVDGNRAPPLPCEVRTVIKGDSLSLSIAAASIAAKVSRDRVMLNLASRYPGYGWHTNMGYGTAEHQAALKRLGVTPEHRQSYAPIRLIAAEKSE